MTIFDDLRTDIENTIQDFIKDCERDFGKNKVSIVATATENDDKNQLTFIITVIKAPSFNG